MSEPIDLFKAGQRVCVTQQIPHRRGTWATRVTGVVVRFEQRQTGSWYAHAKGDKLWLDRLTLCKEDGEIVMCNLDRYAHVEILDQADPCEHLSLQGSEPGLPSDPESETSADAA